MVGIFEVIIALVMLSLIVISLYVLSDYDFRYYNMGIVYNAGNEQYYYRQYRSEANENIMNNNGFNPYFIKTEINHNY